MKLIRLTLRNFKGVREFTLNANGNDVDILGDNGSGKTSIADAFTWLMFGKDSQNRADFELKTLDTNGEPIHGLNHEVEAVLDLGDRRVTLRKVYSEKWTKKRGSATAEFTGHTTDHFVDGVPVKKQEYQSVVAGIADESVFRLLTDPAYFNQHLPWQKRREILLNVCGDVSDEDVIAADESLKELLNILSGRRLEDHRKVLAAERARINKELEKIPVRIDEVAHSIPNIEGIIPEVLAEDIQKLRAERRVKEEERVRIQSGGEIAEKQRRLAEIDAEMAEIRNQLRARVDEEAESLRRMAADAAKGADEIRAKLSAAKSDLREMEDKQKRIEKRLEELRAEWKEVSGRKLEFSQPDTCPACGQPIPHEQIEEAREKAAAEFNSRKARELESINNQGKRLREELDAIQAKIEKQRAVIEEAEKKAAEADAEMARLRERTEAILKSAPDPNGVPEYRRLAAEKRTIEAEIEALKAGNSDALERVSSELETIDMAIQALEEAAAKVEQHARAQERIEELKAEERRLASEYEELERQLFLTDQFIRTKVQLLEDRINSRFRMARFKLFDVQVNGAVVECCETTYQGVPYSSLNHGSRINVGLDVINTLADHFGFAPPIFVDNAETVTRLIPTRGQLIRLVVSEADKSLRTVMHHEKNAEVA